MIFFRSYFLRQLLPTAVSPPGHEIATLTSGADFKERSSSNRTLPDAHPEPESIVAVVVTARRPVELARLLAGLNQQTRCISTIIVVDNGGLAETAAIVACHPRCVHVVSLVNLGGAGGFALGLLKALTQGADLAWVMDDDGCPADANTLEGLIDAMSATGWDAVSPLVVDEADATRLSFPFKSGFRLLTLVADLPMDRPVRGFAHLFNGLLIRRAALLKTGLPDVRLFLRGDEIDFHFRMKRQGVTFGTVPAVHFRHPSSRCDIVPIIPGILHVVCPAEEHKRTLFFRNRGYLTKRHGLWMMLARDLCAYPWFFIVLCRGDWRGMQAWFTAFARGFREHF